MCLAFIGIPDDKVIQDKQAPLNFIKSTDGIGRGMAHIRMEWDDALHDAVGNGICGNGRNYDNQGNQIAPFCQAVGRIRHLGTRFNASNDSVGGMPVHGQPEIVGPTGGYGWLLKLNGGAPHTLRIKEVEMTKNTSLLFSVAYPLGTGFKIAATTPSWCYQTCSNWCREDFSSVATLSQVRYGEGNVYHYDTTTGLLTIRITMYPATTTGSPTWKLYDFDDKNFDGTDFALRRFERDGVLLPIAAYSDTFIEIVADCAKNGAYCAQAPLVSSSYDRVCSDGYVQVSYDKCCTVNGSSCEYAFDPSVPTIPTNPSPPPSSSSNILVNGGFENSKYGICPWDATWNVNAIAQSSDVFSGKNAALITRTNSWDGIYQNITEKFQIDRRYTLSGRVKILSSLSTNSFLVQLRLDYNTKSQWPWIYENATIPNNQWFQFQKEFTITRSYLRTDDGPLSYVELQILSRSDKAVKNFVLDDLSLFPVEV